MRELTVQSSRSHHMHAKSVDRVDLALPIVLVIVVQSEITRIFNYRNEIIQTIEGLIRLDFLSNELSTMRCVRAVWRISSFVQL